MEVSEHQAAEKTALLAIVLFFEDMSPRPRPVLFYEGESYPDEVPEAVVHSAGARSKSFLVSRRARYRRECE